jgi:hypothetical protein
MTVGDVFSLLVVVALGIGGVAYAIFELRKLVDGGIQLPSLPAGLPDDPIVVRERRGRLLMRATPLVIVLGIALLFTALAGASVSTGFLAGASASTVLLLVTAWHVRGIVAPRTVVIIDHEGVDFVRARIGIVPWEYIEGIRVVTSEDEADYLVVDVTDVELLLGSLRGWRAALARLRMAVAPMPTIGVRLADTTPDAEGVLALLVPRTPEQ